MDSLNVADQSLYQRRTRKFRGHVPHAQNVETDCSACKPAEEEQKEVTGTVV